MRTILNRLFGAVFLRLVSHQHVAGLKLHITDPSVSFSEASSLIISAMSRLSETDSRLHCRVLRQVRHVIIWPGGYTAFDRWGGVHLASYYLRAAPPEVLAAALVHEATHLRIERRGIRYKPEIRERIERICVKEQVYLLRKAGADERLAKDAIDALTTEWWTEDSRREAIEAEIEEASLPKWLAPLLYHRM